MYLNIGPAHGIGRKGARAAKTKYYLEEEARYERLTEGGDFVLSRRSEPLRLCGPEARNFGLCLDTFVTWMLCYMLLGCSNLYGARKKSKTACGYIS